MLRGMRKLAVVLVMIVATALAVRACGGCSGAPPRWRFATFNIQDYPKHGRQAANAFVEIAKLDATVVAVQEITDPASFAREAKTRLGKAWRFESLDTSPLSAGISHRLGVLFDTRAWVLVDARGHDDTRLDSGRWKPIFEVRLRAVPTGEVVSVLVVHLKAGGDGRDIRAQQYVALTRIVDRVVARGDRVIVMGDFNATDEVGDRDDLATLARDSGLAWATEPLACSAFWDRDDGCFRSRLDHVLAWRRPLAIEALGGCATDGCSAGDRCPRYVADVSDHCPVVATITP